MMPLILNLFCDGFLTRMASSTKPPPTPPQPLWAQIAQALRERITQGQLKPGERLPSDVQLAEHFGVNRHTLRQAIQSLVQQGHLRVQQGSGTYVRALVLDYALQRRTRMTHNLAQAGEAAQRELLHHQVQAAGEWAQALQLGARSKVVVLTTRASLRGRPIGLGTTAYPLPRLADMPEAFLRCGSITEALRSLGVQDYVRAQSTVSCRLPSSTEADLLARPKSEPVLVVQFQSVDSSGLPVEAGRTLFAADAVQLTVEHAA
jgi:GntR family transcriptional regulator, phosphonate transport system regulatory protein